MKATLVAQVVGTNGFRTRHYWGLPPDLAEITGGEGQVIDMPRAEFITIEPDPSGFFLIRYLRNGDFAGDTWHQTLEEAKHQAEFEFGTSDADWVTVPEDQDNPGRFMMSWQTCDSKRRE